MKCIASNDLCFLSKEVSKCVKGISAVFVMLHHFYQRTYFISNPYIGKLFQMFGYLAVSIFFFYSGYGLMVSYLSHEKAYIANFPRKRLLPFYCTYVVFILITLIQKVAVGDQFSLMRLFSSFFFHGTIVTYGWYFQTILLFYIIFYLFFKLMRCHHNGLCLMSLFVVFYIVICHIFDEDPALYISCLSFVLGLLFPKLCTTVCKIFQERYLYMLISGALFSLLVCISFLSDSRHLRYSLMTLSSPCFVIFVMLLISVIYENHSDFLVNRITRWLGANSLEIYFSQGVFFELFRSNLVRIDDSCTYIGLVLVCTMVFSPLLHIFVRFIRSSLQQVVQ